MLLFYDAFHRPIKSQMYRTGSAGRLRDHLPLRQRYQHQETGLVLTNRLLSRRGIALSISTRRCNNLRRIYASTVRIRLLTCTSNEQYNFRYRKYAAMYHVVWRSAACTYTWGR